METGARNRLFKQFVNFDRSPRGQQIVDPIDATVFRQVNEIHFCTARGEFPADSFPGPFDAVIRMDVCIENDEYLALVPLDAA